MEQNKILSIDPSGQGSTGFCLIDEATGEVEFREVTSGDFQKHFDAIVEVTKYCKPNIVIYEATNYIHPTNKGLGMTGLFKVIGFIEGLSRFFDLKVESRLAMTVKQLHSKLYDYKNSPQLWSKFIKVDLILKHLSYKDGRPKKGEEGSKGWLWNGKHISVHQLDALLVYCLWKQSGKK